MIFTQISNQSSTSSPATSRLLTKRQAAARLNICPHTLMRWHHQGRLHCIRLNERTIRFDESEIERLINEARN